MNDELIWIPEMREEMGIPKSDFDAAVLTLIRKDILIPHRHVHVARMTDQEREDMVTDGESWFCGCVLNVVGEE